jgi:hypothetical protein
VQRQRIEEFLVAQLRGDCLDLLITGEAGWAEHDRRLPLLQGAARALQLAAAADLPLLGNGPRRLVPMLTLTALQEEEGLHLRAEVLEREVWKLPLPAGEQLELAVVKGGTYLIGSPQTEDGRDFYPNSEGVNYEAQRKLHLKEFAMARQAITQAQWRAVASWEPQKGERWGRELNPKPATFQGEEARLLAGAGFWRESAVLADQPCALAVVKIARMMRFELRAEYPARAVAVLSGAVQCAGQPLAAGTLEIINAPGTVYLDAVEPSVLVLMAGQD